jgi:hypothetical protein
MFQPSDVTCSLRVRRLRPLTAPAELNGKQVKLDLKAEF